MTEFLGRFILLVIGLMFLSAVMQSFDRLRARSYRSKHRELFKLLVFALLSINFLLVALIPGA